MSDSLPLGGKKLSEKKNRTKDILSIVKNNNIILVSIAFIIFGLMLRIWNAQPVFYAHAYTGGEKVTGEIQSPLFDNRVLSFEKNDNKNKLIGADSYIKNRKNNSSAHASFADKIYAIVGEAPIKKMVPFISKREEKVAAFLVGIAKKESGFGDVSPSKDGETCYNYWGYKGSAGNGSALGYACFGSAEEAVEIVGDRIEVLVMNKNRNTPARMVNTWKCGSSCAGDPGAQGWISTVAAYFEKIVS